jgi:hypothetical protein
MKLHTENECEASLIHLVLLERDELPELQPKRNKMRKTAGKKEQGAGDTALRVSIGRGAPK